MKKNMKGKQAHPLLVISVLTLFFFLSGCLSEPVPSFSADRVTITAGDSVQFTDMSSDHPQFWIWTFEGGSPSSSTEQDPTITYMYEGTYQVSLEVYNRAGGNILTRNNYITVSPPTTDVTFINNTYTQMLIEIEGDVKSISSGGQVTFYGLEGNSVDYNAVTSGKNTEGVQLGHLLTWSYTIDLPGTPVEWELNVNSDYFFLFVTNNGTHALSPLYINDGSVEPYTEDVYLPADGNKYRIGYYYAWEQTEVRGYYEDDPDNYTYWTQLNYPGTSNQSVELNNPYKKSAVVNHGERPDPGETKLPPPVPASPPR